MVSPGDAAAACREVLAGLDPDTLEYIAGGVLDEDSGEVRDVCKAASAHNYSFRF
jgi:hypothetical protein